MYPNKFSHTFPVSVFKIREQTKKPYFGRERRIRILQEVPEFVLQVPTKTGAEVTAHVFITI